MSGGFVGVVGDAELRIVALLGRASQGREAGSPATVQYLGVYPSADGWNGCWGDVSRAIKNLIARGKVRSLGGFGTDERIELTPSTGAPRA